MPGSPFKVPVEPHMSTKDVVVTGLQPVVFTNAINEFQVDTSKLPKPDDHKVECAIVKPDGTRQAAKVESTGNGKFKVTHIPKEVGKLGHGEGVGYAGYSRLNVSRHSWDIEHRRG